MLRLFRSSSRGRRKGQHDHVWSPLPHSPETSRNRPSGLNGAEDGFSDDENDQFQPLSPRQRPNGMPSLFFRNRREVNQDDGHRDSEDEEDMDEDADHAPLLPIFSAALLDKLPLYNITHAIRLIIVQRCETTLSWDQLRSPQISQFMVKPIESRIRSDHFNRATLCALIANCLQFRKEGQMYPGNVGVSRTRALISELLAMRLLREFTTRELIDALSYDFDPLQGIMSQGAENARSGQRQLSDLQSQRAVAKGARLSTIEIAIRAEAKRFLAHPLVVQHLEAIWAGNIVFQSKADHLHRGTRQSRAEYLSRTSGYGTIDERSQHILPAELLPPKNAHGKASNYNKMIEEAFARRTVTLYNPRYASMFKLSRLRVPRYRQVFSTLSFAIMLGLFLAVLVERSIDITPLEILFWFWSAGYMLDEVVGFTEQGFGLYLLSFWNAFDVGILLLFAVYYCLRLYSVVLDGEWREQVAGTAYDVLASTAILLFPRLFNILDHYRYFSQLLIAFRLMMQDLIAILILILISASGFFVAFTFGMTKRRTTPNEVAWALFQMVMGFTPAAWDNWGNYNVLGQIILGSFLILCHFLIVTILITVLTNSFMAIVKNAEEEHQFLFAINTISMVKSDALFSYVAPTNIIGWILSPLRFTIPLQQYVRFNRMIIKITHFPILFIIFAYERLILAKSAFTPTELVESQPTKRKEPIAFALNRAPELFSPNLKMREPSLVNFNKNRALDEVFRRPFHGDTLKTTTKGMDIERRGSGTAVDKWMQAAEIEGGAAPPLEQPRGVLERLEHRRPQYKRAATADKLKLLTRSRDFSVATRSVASDPDATSLYSTRRPLRTEEEMGGLDRSIEHLPQETDADGDDETNEQSDHPTPALNESTHSLVQMTSPRLPSDNNDYFKTSTAVRTPTTNLTSKPNPYFGGPSGTDNSDSFGRKKPNRRWSHDRHYSTGTILFAPKPNPLDFDTSDTGIRGAMRQKYTHDSRRQPGNTPPSILLPSEHPTRPKVSQPTKLRPAVPNRQKTAPALVAAATGLSFLNPHNQRRSSLTTRALDLASEIGDNRWNPSGLAATVEGAPSMAGSFSEQLMRERERQRRAEDDEKGMVGRILLSRMATLEEGFREVLREVKDLSNYNSSQPVNSSSRRVSDGDDSTTGFLATVNRNGGVRPRIETGSSSLSTSVHTPKTIVGRIGGLNDGKKGKSPRKNIVGKEGKRKGKDEGERTSGSLGEEAKTYPKSGLKSELAEPSPDSVGSVIELTKGEEDQEPARRNTIIKLGD